MFSSTPAPDMDLHVITLSGVRELLDDDVVAALFGRTIALRLDGYGGEYEQASMPVDQSDLFCTHLLLCRRAGDGSSYPVSAIRSVTYADCLDSGLQFPAFDGVNGVEALTARLALQDVVLSYQGRPADLAYVSGWTVDRPCRGDLTVRSAMFATVLAWHQTHVCEWIAGAVLRFKSEQRLFALGGEPLSGIVRHPGLNGEAGMLVRMRQPNEVAAALMTQFQHLWEGALHLGAPRWPGRL